MLNIFKGNNKDNRRRHYVMNILHIFFVSLLLTLRMYSFAGIYIKLGFRFTWFDLPVFEISYLRNLQLDNSCGPLVITVCNIDLSFKLIWLLSEQSQLQMKNRTYSKYKLTITLLSIECMPIDKCSHPIETTHLNVPIQ